MRSLMLLLLGGMLIGFISYWCFINKGEDIANDLISKTKTAYKSNALDWVDVSVEGKGINLTRIILLKGETTSKEDKNKATSIAKSIDGVMKVDNKIDIIMPKVVDKVIVAPKKELKLEIPKISCQEKFNNIFLKNSIIFEPNSNMLLKQSYEVLDDLVKITKECSHDSIIIGGYTDSDGSSEYNKKLSQKRADEVKKYLVEHDINGTRLDSIGYGEKNPIADNNTTEGKQKNRRIEFKIKGEEI